MALAEERRWFGEQLLAVYRGEVSASDLRALIEGKAKGSKELQEDPESNESYHMLLHYEADEDIRAKDPDYAAAQRQSLLTAAERLLKGE